MAEIEKIYVNRTIKGKKHFMGINADEFDPKTDEIVKGEAPESAEKSVEEITDEPEGIIESTGDSESTGDGGEEEPKGKTLNDMNRAELVEELDRLGLKLEDVPYKGNAVTNDEIRAYIVEKVPAQSE